MVVAVDWSVFAEDGLGKILNFQGGNPSNALVNFELGTSLLDIGACDAFLADCFTSITTLVPPVSLQSTTIRLTSPRDCQK